jgi:FKBP-type peptidyl-prolyl cis-trans isomerase
MYKITHGEGNQKKLEQGQWIKYNIEFKFKLKSKDTILSSTFGKIPEYLSVDTNNLGKYSFTEILMKSKKGDKIEFSLSLDTLAKMGALQLNEFFKSKDIVIGKVEIIDVFTDVAKVEADYNKESESEKKKEISEIKTYLQKNKIKAIESPEGVFVVAKEIGDASNIIDTTKIASINYRCYSITGEIFDTNIKPNDSTAKPLDVIIGTGGVIPGWEIGLRYFGKGGKGTIYVPAMLAYGPRPNGPIKSYSNLVFDLEIQEVTKKVVGKK